MLPAAKRVAAMVVFQPRTFSREPPSTSEAAACDASVPAAVPSHSSPSVAMRPTAASKPSPMRKDSASTARSRSSSRVIAYSATASVMAVTQITSDSTMLISTTDACEHDDQEIDEAHDSGGRAL